MGIDDHFFLFSSQGESKGRGFYASTADMALKSMCILNLQLTCKSKFV
jgi:hypothetical protein